MLWRLCLCTSSPFLVSAFEAALHRETCEFCKIHSLQNFFLYFLKKAERLRISQLCIDFLWIQGACNAAGFPVVWRNVLAICYKSLYFLYVFLLMGRQILLFVSVSPSEVGEDALSLALMLVSEWWGGSTRRFLAVPAWGGARSVQPSSAACS